MNKACEKCNVVKNYTQFRYVSRLAPTLAARRLLSKFCKRCRFEMLASDKKKIATALSREEISAPEAARLSAKIDARTAAAHAATAQRMREKMTDLHARRRLIAVEMGVTHPVLQELRLRNPEQAAAIINEASRKYANIKARAKRGDRGAQKKMQTYLTKGAKVTAR